MRNFSRTIGALATVLLGFSVSCGDLGSTTEAEELASPGNGCGSAIDIQVSFAPTATHPSFDWTPRCGIAWLTVQTVQSTGGAPALMWALSAPELNPVKPVIEYGVLPRGGRLQTGPTNLVRGMTYKISVDNTVGLDVLVAHGATTFTIP